MSSPDLFSTFAPPDPGAYAGAPTRKLPVVGRLASPVDPETSVEAAEHHEQSGKLTRNQNAVLALVIEHPDCTACELHARQIDTALTRHEISRRLPELARDVIRGGIVIRARRIEMRPARECTVAGTKQHTWRAVVRPVVNGAAACTGMDRQTMVGGD